MLAKVTLSFISIFFGWAAGLLYFIVALSLVIRQGITDLAVILGWTAFFVVIAWFIFILPLIFVVPETSKLFSLRVCPLFGAFYGLIVFLLLVGWWTGLWAESLYLGYALIIGLVTGASYSGLLYLRTKKLGGISKRRAA